MAKNRSGDGCTPFLKAEDLHIWLISLTLFMFLNSSLSFACNELHSPEEQTWVDLGEFT